VNANLAFRLVTAGLAHSCGVVSVSNLAYCWGDNSQGQLGDNTTTDRTSPVAVAGALQYRGLSAGGFHTCASGMSSTVFCWGDNDKGQLGDGTTTDRLSPAFVLRSFNFIDAEAGHRHTCAADITNHAFCWGDGSSGQLGVGNLLPAKSPVQVAGGLAYRVPSAGSTHTSVATASFGGAYSWGANGSGQLGDNTVIQRLTPTAVVP